MTFMIELRGKNGEHIEKALRASRKAVSLLLTPNEKATALIKIGFASRRETDFRRAEIWIRKVEDLSRRRELAKLLRRCRGGEALPHELHEDGTPLVAALAGQNCFKKATDLARRQKNSASALASVAIALAMA